MSGFSGDAASVMQMGAVPAVRSTKFWYIQICDIRQSGNKGLPDVVIFRI